MAIDYNRQYVGARYVPRFFENVNGSWDWAQGFQYEPLTIVKYGENSYTSKKLVPDTVGSPNENPEYWANTGNYNGFISNINAQITSLVSDIQVLNYKTSVNTLLITDSYGTNEASGTDNFMNLCLSENENIQGRAMGGTGFGSHVYIQYNFLDILKSLNVINKNIIKNIIVAGGANDGNLVNDGRLSENTLADAIQEFLDYCKENFPYATVYVGFIGGYKGTQRNISYRKTMNVYHDVANANTNAASIYGDFTIMQNVSFFRDSVHPNSEASRLLADMINCVIKGTTYYYARYSHPAATPLGDWALGTTYIDTYFTPANCQLMMLGKDDTWLHLTLVQNKEFIGYQTIELLSLTEIPYITEALPWKGEIAVGLGSNVTRQKVTLYYTHDKILMTPEETFTAKVILIPPFSIQIPYMI